MNRLLVWAFMLGIMFLPISPIILALIFLTWLITAPVHLPITLARQSYRRHRSTRPLI